MQPLPIGPRHPPGPDVPDRDVATAKAALRRAVRAARARTRPDVRESQQAAVRDALLDLLSTPVHGRDLVLLHAAVGSELDPLAGSPDALTAQGWSLALPRVDGDTLAVVAWSVGAPLAAGFRGVPEPTGPPLADAALVARLAVVVVPGLAYDRRGARLGQGGGHYDRLLARLDAIGAVPLVVAPAFELQVVETVPRLPHDRFVDVLVLPTGPLRTRIAPG